MFLFQNVATTQRHTHPVYQILWVYQAFPLYRLVMIFTGHYLLFIAITNFTAAYLNFSRDFERFF
jgi:hypothetical protein